MKKLYIIELEEITCCGECKFKEKDKSNCPMYNEFSGCPLIELKPEELKWKEYDKRKHISAYGINPNETCKIYVSNTPIGRAIIEVLINARGIKIDFHAITKYTFACNELIIAKQSVEKAKHFCQYYYNKIFFEMLGVKK